MPRLFLSHASPNNAAALALAQWLREEGWVASRSAAA
jgi:hypothetical protein